LRWLRVAVGVTEKRFVKMNIRVRMANATPPVMGPVGKT
jgi:hypothetical protein